MNWDAVSAVSEVAGLIVIVASLIYIGVQTKQANDHATALSEISMLEGIDKVFSRWTDDRRTTDVIREGFRSFNELDKSDQALFQMYVGSLVNQWVLAQSLSARNLLSRELAEQIEKDIISVLSTDGGLEYWEYDSKLTPGGEELLKSVQEARGRQPSWTDLLPWWAPDE